MAFAALLPVATLLVAPAAAAADPIVASLEHENGNAGTLGVPPVAHSLRAAIQEAHALSGSAEVVVQLKPEATYVIERSTVVGGQSSEGTEHDPDHGDLDISRDLTIEGEGATIDAQGLGRIFDIRGNVRVTIRNLTLIRGGNFATGQAEAINDGGGAVRISGGAHVVFENVRFEDNQVVGSGNHGERRGGAMYVAGDGNDVHVRDCHFEGNGVRTGQIGQVVAGGAIYHSGGLLSVARTRFIRCWAMQEPAGTSIFRAARGGAISVESGDVVIMASEFEENSARGADGVGTDIADPRGQAAEGGAIYLGDGTGWFGAEDTVFRRNSAKAGRGGAAPGGSDAAFQRKGGTASGGAVFAKSAQAHFMMDFKRCLFEENLAFGQEGGYSPVLAGAGGDVRGGALFVDGGALDLLDVKFRGNAAIAGDGGFTVAPHEMSLEGSSARGGSGGSARGGAVFVDSQTSAVYVRGSHQPEVSMESTNLTASALFEGNHALGGYGRPGMDNREADGAGGPAAGGGMWIAAGQLELLNVFAHGNSAQGGGGANLLGQSRFSESDATNPTLFGPGGSNGEARGGFLYVTSAETRIEKSNLAFNRAAGGRLAGRVLHSVPPENNGVWSASQPETAVPFSAGNAGYGSIWAGIYHGARGGNGGDAHGGAIYGTRRLVLRQTGVMYNEAVGAHGGAGGRAKDTPGKAQRGGDGGRGGSAFGAGIALSNSASFDIEASMLFGNLAMAGSGGSGGQGSDNSNTTYNEDCDGCGGSGGFGGAGGSAAGGALFADCYSADPGQNARLVLCYVAENKAVAGDGFFGGNGGLGAGNVGGNGGLGGDGGNALGGGIATTALHMERSTVDQNLVSGGWGGSAGHGGVGSYAGGAGSVGGAAGQASGGGVFVRKPATLAPGARFVLSTLSNNRVYSGFGGQGGCGGPAYVFAGPGLNGGRNGLARGGGLFVEEGAAQVQLTDSTVAGNTVDAGGGGFAGIGAALIGGPVHPLDHPVRYQAATSVQLVDVGGLLVPAPPIAHGAASVLRDRTGFALGGPPSPNAYAAPLEHDGNGFVLFNEDRVSDVVATAAAATGAPIAATGALVGTAVFAGYLWANAGGFGAATTLALGGAGLAFAHVGAVGAVLAVGAVVAVTYIGAVIDTGDWALAAEYTLGTPGNVSRYNLGHLLTGAASRDDDDDGIIPQPGPNGAQGEYRAPEGSGIHGAASIRGTLVGDNSAFRRRRPFAEKKVGLVAFYEYDEFRDHLGSVSDLAGGVTSQGGNFVSVAPPGFTTSTHDIVGSSGSPLTARVAPSVGDHGGGVPTLKLRPGSPARGAVPLGGQQSQSQNGFTWADGGSRDIGAWGGPPNRPPVAANQVFRLVQGSGGSASFGTLGLAASQFDPDGDELSIVLQETVNTGGSWIVYLILGDPVNRGFSYTPAQNFAGIQEIFHFSVTDGEFESNVGTIYAQVVPPEAAFQCPPGGSGRIIPIGSESSTIGTARHVEFPASARVDHNFTGPFTVEFWMNLIRPSGWAHEHEPLITKGDSAWRVQRAGFTSKLAFDVTGLEPLSLHSQRDVLQGWHHVAAVYDGRYKLLYIDGELDSWQEVTGVP